MKEIVVVSGKGGTGKTSFVASFAALARVSIALGDCDVDAANLALLMPGKDIHKEPFYAGYRARVDTDLCTGCGECIEACRYNAIRVENGLAMTDDFFCEGCRACSVVCPEDAIGFVENRSGTLFHRETEAGPMVHGELGIAQDNSGKLVAKVREDTRNLAEKKGVDLILLDGPPGIGCPVHAAIGGANLVVAVSEPTPSGHHDLKRALDLCAHFKLKAVVIVNKFDLNEELSSRIEQLAINKGARPVGRVPFDKEVPRALSRGELPIVVEKVRIALEQVWDEIEKELF
ncbi:MAG: (4Fe-4S)-binding protein [Proteobacteria bacterium]|nr:(4Fe-4S)-binding protein [Pseudomonadota bacterium]